MAEKNINNHIFNDDEDSILDLDIRTEIHFSGKDHPEGKMVPVLVDGKEEYILIPLDIKDGATIKVCGRGKHNPRSGKTGDLYVLVHIGEKVNPKNRLLICAVIVALFVVSLMIACGIGALFAHLSLPEKEACAPTNYAIKMEADVRTLDDGVTGAGWWWLRSPGEKSNQAAFVNFDGTRYTNGVGNGYLSVRPALWVKLSGLQFS